MRWREGFCAIRKNERVRVCFVQSRWQQMRALWQDVRYGIRILGKNPAFTLTAVLTLALGIGANTAIFSVMNVVLLRLLPVSNAERLVCLHFRNQPLETSQTGYGDLSLSEPAFEALRTQREVFSDLVAFVPLAFNKTIVRFGEHPEEAAVDMVSGNFFSGLGLPPLRGRIFTAQDELQHTQVAVLSYNFWTRRFARNPSVLGETLYVKGVAFTIVGIAAQNFSGVEQGGSTDLWRSEERRVGKEWRSRRRTYD